MTCQIRDCDSPRYCRGWCSKHYQRWLRHGDPLARRKSEFEWFVEAVNFSSGCWEWTAGRGDHGYGTTRWEGRTVLTHRLAYQLWVGPIPLGLTIDHLCRNRGCVNPRHLEAVTMRENTRRGMCHWAVVVREGQCKRGHEMTPENTYYRPDGAGRACRMCLRIREANRARRQHTKKAAA